MSLASGVSVITESIYDTRFGYCAELNRMGASIKVDTKVAIITGVEKLHGCTVRAATCARRCHGHRRTCRRPHDNDRGH